MDNTAAALEGLMAQIDTWRSKCQRLQDRLDAESQVATDLRNKIIKLEEVRDEQAGRIDGLSKDATRIMALIHKKQAPPRRRPGR